VKRTKRIVIEFSTFLACMITVVPRDYAADLHRPSNTPDTVERGHAFFANNCGICHGADAHGGDKAPDLNTGRFKHATSDQDLFSVITHGVPGTIMPANNLPAEQLWAIVTYLRSTVVADHSELKGDKGVGKELFWNSGKCANCHMVNGRGGVLGPDLTQVGQARTTQYLRQKIRDPNKKLTIGFHEPNADYVVPISNSTVTVITKLGKRVTGVPKNEDTFSIQMIGTDNELYNFIKSDLKDITHEQKSLMPAFTDSDLSDVAVNDLLAYLTSLHRGGQ
jgi:cytochrome c oxidase cbb3-type subunit III